MSVYRVVKEPRANQQADFVERYYYWLNNAGKLSPTLVLKLCSVKYNDLISCDQLRYHCVKFFGKTSR